MKIAMIGTGYVGLVTGTCFADSGNEVVCVDTDEKKIENLKNGIIPIYEPGLDTLVKRNVEEERLTFTTNLEEAIDKSLLLFIAVGTPPGEDGSADLTYVLNVARDIGKKIKEYKIIVDKSTVPVGTGAKVKEVIQAEIDKRKEKIQFDVVSNPEFLKEGNAIDDFMKPDRVVVGCEDVRTGELMKELYSPFVRTGKPILIMDVPSAEMTKYAANAMLATKISFMNDMANLCEKLGVDVAQVRQGIGSDSRIGYPFIFPGPGYGGSCFPKDVQAIIKIAENQGYKLEIMSAVEAVNNRQKRVLFEKLKKRFGNDLKNKTIAVWGLSFKPNTDDMREAPSIVLIENLIAEGAKIKAYDPEATQEARKIFKDKIVYADKTYEALEGADALVIVTEWNEFRRPNFERMKTAMKSHIIFDGRNLFEPSKMAELGFEYEGIGRKLYK
ncbi:MAG: UDP-glucose/GDP-mannose dehydrogenase family protein [Candidatus Riflebacteria bacterium]|jgi:UDPglucose 6-dehydrogenase|nr:UDP-glucose/GDP-mannose dehydrogenase family protein [Candidatus Riflebacteria bacterium]MDD3377847.1 UDP-glucose/GDP-mannose dehydrogenase family protein [Candidatus Riflebacteria bacterium]NCB47112.1 UDP-glucose/GDP-mannose dehydrogenase family protein [bacterium]